MKSVFKYSIIIILGGLAAPMLSCNSTANLGCTNKHRKQSRRHFVKAVNKCQNEAMAQSLLFFPPIEKDSTWSEVKTQVDTFTHYDTLVVNDTVFITKYVDKIIAKTNTIVNERIVQDTRALNLLKDELKQKNIDLEKLRKEKDAEIAKLTKEKSKTEKSEAKAKGKLVVYHWAIGVLLGSAAISFAVKMIPFFKK